VPEPDQATNVDNADQQTGVAADVITQDTQTGERTDAAPQFDPAALSRAQSLGFDQGEIDALGPANLSMVLRAADRAATAGIPGQQQQQVGADQQQAGQIDPMQFAAALELNKDDVDENVINALNGINSHYANQSVQMMTAIGELVNRITGMNDTVGRMTFNEQVNALGEDWHPVLGPPNARNAKELDRLRQHVGAMQQLGTADYGEAFQRALGSLYFSRLAEMERKALGGRVQRGVDRTSERPRSREEEPAQSGREKATQSVRRLQMAEMGTAP
jgi:hypothetical protein